MTKMSTVRTKNQLSTTPVEMTRTSSEERFEAGGLADATTASTYKDGRSDDGQDGNRRNDASVGSSSVRPRSHTMGFAPELAVSHRSMTVVTRQDSHSSSVKDFLREKNYQLEKAVGLPWKNSAEQEKWNRRRLRMTQRCGMKLRAGVDSDSLCRVPPARSALPDPQLPGIQTARTGRGDFLDGVETHSPVAAFDEAPRLRRRGKSQYDVQQPTGEDSAVDAASSIDVLPKESVLQLTIKGFRRAMGAPSAPKTRNRRLYETTPGDHVHLNADGFPADASSSLIAQAPIANDNIHRVAEVPPLGPSQRKLHVMLPTSTTAEKFDYAIGDEQQRKPKVSVSKTWSLDERRHPHRLPEVAKAPILPNEELKPFATTRFRRAVDDKHADMHVTDAGEVSPEIHFNVEPDDSDEKFVRPPVVGEEGEDVGDGVTGVGLIPNILLQPRQSLLPDMLGRNEIAGLTVSGRGRKRTAAANIPTWDDHRPYFTYWVTTVQILVTCIGLLTYGFGPFGLQKAERSAMVMTTALALEAVDFYEPSSFWLGPRAQHLVHLGAKYTPCMRSERQIKREIQQLRDLERKSACCVRNDGSGCVQAMEEACSPSISRWLRWPDAVGAIGGWTGGSVCGLDPRYCHDPSPTVALLTWNRSDITTWPKCHHNHDNAELSTTPDHYDAECRENGTHCKALALTAEPHMACELLGRPCCYGIRGQCRLATREFCDFVKGYYHEDAFLCSQVSCLEQVCGMVPFFYADRPNQFYRLLTSLFLHAGLLHLVPTVLVQYFYMAELEIMCGWWRMAVVYLLSGITGNLASAIFLPDVPEVGPSGSQFALFGLLLVEVLDKWKYYEAPWRLMLGVIGLVLLFIGLGTLPWIDNFAQTSGFLSGLLLSAFFMPYMAFGRGNRRRFIKWLALALFVVMFTLLVVFFYFLPLDKYDCPACSWLNCIPFYEDFCNDQNSYFFPKGYSSFS